MDRILTLLPRCCSTRNHKRFVAVLRESVLMQYMVEYAANDSMLDLSQHEELYLALWQLLLGLLRAKSLNSVFEQPQLLANMHKAALSCEAQSNALEKLQLKSHTKLVAMIAESRGDIEQVLYSLPKSTAAATEPSSVTATTSSTSTSALQTAPDGIAESTAILPASSGASIATVEEQQQPHTQTASNIDELPALPEPTEQPSALAPEVTTTTSPIPAGAEVKKRGSSKARSSHSKSAAAKKKHRSAAVLDAVIGESSSGAEHAAGSDGTKRESRRTRSKPRTRKHKSREPAAEAAPTQDDTRSSLASLSSLIVDEDYVAAMSKLQFEAIPWDSGAATPSSSVIQRLAMEFATLVTALPCSESSSVFVRVNESNVCSVRALIIGPEDTPYAHGAFEFSIDISNEYPNRPPHVLLRTTGSTCCSAICSSQYSC